jgi:hypothetical protein
MITLIECKILPADGLDVIVNFPTTDYLTVSTSINLLKLTGTEATDDYTATLAKQFANDPLCSIISYAWTDTSPNNGLLKRNSGCTSVDPANAACREIIYPGTTARTTGSTFTNALPFKYELITTVTGGNTKKTTGSIQVLCSSQLDISPPTFLSASETVHAINTAQPGNSLNQFDYLLNEFTSSSDNCPIVAYKLSAPTTSVTQAGCSRAGGSTTTIEGKNDVVCRKV